MSFRREGNDPGLLKNLQHRRVSEILGDFIPDDEALLLSNGRLTCTICPKRPIFDTIQMLSLHRKGKNHLYELSWYLEHKRNSEFKKFKQIHKEYVKRRRSSVPISENKDSSLAYLAQSLHSPKKRFSKFSQERKFILDIADTCKIKNNMSDPMTRKTSANSHVRRYLKSLARKRPLEKAVNTLRANYGARPGAKDQSDAWAKSQQVRQPQDGKSKMSEAHLKTLESGWIKDNDGKWIKDPNVEFDSDEEEPPCLNQTI